MAKHLLAPPQGRCIAQQSQDALRRVLPPPLFTSSSIDSCLPNGAFFLSVKGIAVPKVLMVAGN